MGAVYGFNCQEIRRIVQVDMKIEVRKITRFAAIYGVRRAVVKAFGRLRMDRLKRWYWETKSPTVSILGCGQFSFSTICFFIAKDQGRVFLDAFDTDPTPAKTLGNYYRFEQVTDEAEPLILNPSLERLFIVSNHASHTPYAVKAMEAGVRLLHVEKPLATSWAQFDELCRVRSATGSQIYAGYNRPYAKSIQTLKQRVVAQPEGAFSLNYFISGHQIDDDHWYRNEEEGTRICGNMGHWLDLSIHILSWRGLPEILEVQITYANPSEADDNIVINFRSNLFDLISITLTARSEPFEGINESINFQYGEVIAKIDDFRSMQVWEGPDLKRYRYFPKDVGHRRAVAQVFKTEAENRSWQEVETSTLLMLFITDMVRNGQRDAIFVLEEQTAALQKRVCEFRSQSAD
jgi:predicted dehydrogenase